MSFTVNRFVSQSPVMQNIYAEIEDYATHGINCIFFGPRGCGKEVLAQYYADTFKKVRDSHSQTNYPETPYYSLDCAGLNYELARSELFGHVKGAFTGAIKDKPGLVQEADNGILFLDELGELPRDLQSLLLRALDPGEGRQVGASKSYQIKNLTVICATERPDKDILPSLLDRLEGRIQVPCLDERLEDIPIAVNYFVQDQLSRRKDYKELLSQLISGSTNNNVLAEKIADEIIPLAMARRWPGNLRTLRVNTTVAIARAKDTASVEAFANDVAHYFDEYLERYSRARDARTQIASPENTKQPTSQSDILFQWICSDDIVRIMPRLKEEKKVLLLSFLNGTQGQRFTRKDIQAFFKRHGVMIKNPRTWLEKLCRVDPSTGRALLVQEGSRREIYRLSAAISTTQKDKVLKQTFLPLPLDIIWPDGDKNHLSTMHELLSKTRILFVSGKRGAGKTLIVQALGKELSKDRPVHYYPFGYQGIAWFLQILENTLQEQGLAYPPKTDGEELWDTVARLKPSITKILQGESSLLILDNVKQLTNSNEQKALLAMVTEWSHLSFILVGDKLPNAFLSPEKGKLSIIEYSVETNTAS